MVLLRRVRRKLANGSLPHDSIPRVWGGFGNGEMCDVCDEIVTNPQMLIEGIGEHGRGIQMHVQCFSLWDQEREVIGHEPSGPTGGTPPG